MAEQPETDSYKPLVAIKDVEDFRLEGEVGVVGDRRDGKVYRYTPEIKLAVNVALATGRPLLVLGETGCGKSSLAFNLARLMQRRYYEYVVTSRTQARDLFYRFDAVRRLGDSQLGVHAQALSDQMKSNGEFVWSSQYPYLEPGPLWWIVDPSGAARRGYPSSKGLFFPVAVDPRIWQPESAPSTAALLLIDEIDKAEPDFPNNLLVPLGSWQFTVDEIAKPISLASTNGTHDPMTHPLVIITSNKERELPDTFLRRCIIIEIPSPTTDQLVEIATTVFGPRKDQLFAKIAARLVDIRGQEHLSTAEFLDAVRAIQELQASGSPLSSIIERTSWRPLEP